MEIKSHFSGIKDLIISDIKSAKSEVLIAVAWFTHQEIFDAIVNLPSSVKVSIVIINDDVNNRYGGLNFQQFIDQGGQFYFGLQEMPMHHKYCIIDSRVLITGSYNYTYYAENINKENVIRIEGVCDVINEYRNNFIKITSALERINSIVEFHKLHPYTSNGSAFENYVAKDIYQQAVALKDSGNTEHYQELLDVLPKTESESTFAIKDVMYKQWQSDYYIEKINVTDSEIILSFKSLHFSGGWLFGPKTIASWSLRESQNDSKYYLADAITNIRLNGECICENAQPYGIYYFGKEPFDGEVCIKNGPKITDKQNIVLHPYNCSKYCSENESGILSCDIHFKAIELKNSVVDLIEANDRTKERFWNAFDIDLRQNRLYD